LEREENVSHWKLIRDRIPLIRGPEVIEGNKPEDEKFDIIEFADFSTVCK
jgi:hypothetical protein